MTIVLNNLIKGQSVEVADSDIARATQTGELMKHPFEPGHPLMDRLYVCAKTEFDEDNRVLRVIVDDETPTVAMDNALADELTEKTGRQVLAVPRIRSGQDTTDYTLLSSGGFLKVEDKFVVFERTVTAPNGNVIAWPKAKNNPMGRVDGMVSNIAYKEMAEEIAMYSEVEIGGKSYIQPYYYEMEKTGETGIAVERKMEIFRELADDMTKQGKPFVGNFLEPKPLTARPDKSVEDQMWTVRTEYNGEVIDEAKLLVVESKGERTIETATAIDVDVPEGYDLKILSFEPTGRQTFRVSRGDLAMEIMKWAKGEETVYDAQQDRDVVLGGALPITNALFGMREAYATPKDLSMDMRTMTKLCDFIRDEHQKTIQSDKKQEPPGAIILFSRLHPRMLG